MYLLLSALLFFLWLTGMLALATACRSSQVRVLHGRADLIVTLWAVVSVLNALALITGIYPAAS